MATSKNTESILAGQLIAGIKRHFPDASSLAFGNGTFTPAQIESSLQTIINLRADVSNLKAATQAKVATERTQAVPLRTQMAAFVEFVRVTFGNSPDVLADFGLKPKKAKAPMTLQQKTTAAARRAATRKARQTLGKNQKKEVKGTITTIVTSTPSPLSNSPAAPPAPVASVAVQGTSAGSATSHGT